MVGALGYAMDAIKPGARSHQGRAGQGRHHDKQIHASGGESLARISELNLACHPSTGVRTEPVTRGGRPGFKQNLKLPSKPEKASIKT